MKFQQRATVGEFIYFISRLPAGLSCDGWSIDRLARNIIHTVAQAVDNSIVSLILNGSDLVQKHHPMEIGSDKWCVPLLRKGCTEWKKRYAEKFGCKNTGFTTIKDTCVW